LSDPFASLAAEHLALLERRPQPRRFEPMKAVLTDEPFTDPDWLFERKLDGIRCGAFRSAGRVRLLSRTGRSLNGAYPELVEALSDQETDDFVVDGEVVAFEGSRTSFSKLQRAARERVRVFLYLFDLLHLDGRDTTELPLRARKAVLRRALRFHGPVRFTPHRKRDGEALYRDACRRGWEGLIAKRADSRYRVTRSRDWLKLKCSAQQELVVGGYTAPQGSRVELGALLVGYYEDGRLRYAGKVGTGFDRDTLHRLGARLRRLERDESPFAHVHPVPKGTRWVRPELVAEIAFTEWTRDGRLRHPRYLGLRDDKRPREVVREVPS
jgi:bifunctional non-homologous end joining protein LigD